MLNIRKKHVFFQKNKLTCYSLKYVTRKYVFFDKSLYSKKKLTILINQTKLNKLLISVQYKYKILYSVSINFKKFDLNELTELQDFMFILNSCKSLHFFYLIQSSNFFLTVILQKFLIRFINNSTGKNSIIVNKVHNHILFGFSKKIKAVKKSRKKMLYKLNRNYTVNVKFNSTINCNY